MVLLRPYRSGDVDLLYEAVRESIVELSPWMVWCHANYSMEESRDWVESRAGAWERGTEYSFVITDAEEGLFLGGCGLDHINQAVQDPGIANLGYWVRSSRIGKGVATSVVRLLAGFGFGELGLNRIEIIIAVGNKSSRRVAEKAGAKREGILRNRLFVDEQVRDAVMFSLIPQDIV